MNPCGGNGERVKRGKCEREKGITCTPGTHDFHFHFTCPCSIRVAFLPVHRYDINYNIKN